MESTIVICVDNTLPSISNFRGNYEFLSNFYRLDKPMKIVWKNDTVECDINALHQNMHINVLKQMMKYG